MTLDNMCLMAARLSDRDDEFVKTAVEGADPAVDEYQEDALRYFNIFRDAINEAYHDVARNISLPDAFERVAIANDRMLDLTTFSNMVYTVKNVMNPTHTAAVKFNFYTSDIIEIVGGNVGDYVDVYYSYLPDRLALYTDTPIFAESLVDPMVYVSLAVARMWQSEKKIANYNSWMAEYYQKLRNVKPFLGHDGRPKRMRRPSFR